MAARSFVQWQLGFGLASPSKLLMLSSARWQSPIDGVATGGNGQAGISVPKAFWDRARP